MGGAQVYIMSPWSLFYTFPLLAGPGREFHLPTRLVGSPTARLLFNTRVHAKYTTSMLFLHRGMFFLHRCAFTL